MQNHPKTDSNGWPYFDHLPDGYRLASMDDFHINGSKKIGMQYLIQRGNQPYFEVHQVRAETRAVNLKPFCDFNMIFIKG